MKRPLWVQKLSNAQLKEMISYADDIEITGKVRFNEVKNILIAWYYQRTGMERAIAFCVDVYKEAAFRWMKQNGLTFSFGENDDFDFFIEGVFGEFDFPISDQNFERRGFYNYMNAEYDNVFVISSVSKHDLIPHFEITAR